VRADTVEGLYDLDLWESLLDRFADRRIDRLVDGAVVVGDIDENRAVEIAPFIAIARC
jgi:hypothetical protein